MNWSLFPQKDYSYAQAMGDVNDGIIETIKEKGLANRLSDKDAILPILQSAKR